MQLPAISKATKYVLLAVSVTLFASALGVRFWASLAGGSIAGPDHIAVGEQHVYLHANGYLYVLSRSGDVDQRIPRRDLGLNDTPVDLRVLAGGRLLLAGQSPAVIRVCRTENWSCRRASLPEPVDLKRQFKILQLGAGGDYFIADTESGALWRGALDNAKASRIAAPGLLKRPHDLAVDGKGRLWIADAGHARLVAIDAAADERLEPVRELATDHALATMERDWPVMLAIDVWGRLWATQSDGNARHAALFVYAPDDTVEARVALPQGAYPTDVAAAGTSMLVTDMDRFAVYRIDARTHEVRAFGGGSFARSMARARQEKQWYESVSSAAMLGVLVLALPMIGTAVWLTPRGKRWSAAEDELTGETSEAAGAGPPGELYWLARNPKIERLVRRLVPVYTTVAVATVVVLVALQWYLGEFLLPDDPDKAGKLTELRQLVSLLTILLLGMWPMVKLGHSYVRRRLGSDGEYLYVREPDGRVETLVPEQLVYSARLITDGARVISVRTGDGRSIYEPGELKQYVQPLLARAERLNGLQMSWRLLMMREPMTMYALIFAVGFGSYLYFSGLWRLLFD